MFDKLKKRFALAVEQKRMGATVRRLVGHKNVVYYNLETNAWNTCRYNGYKICDQERNGGYALKLKGLMEQAPNLDVQYEMVAPVTMTVDPVFHTGGGNMVSYPCYSKRGTTVVGNIIIKNKETGEYKLCSKNWICVSDYLSPLNAADFGAMDFTYYACCWDDFRAAVRRNLFHCKKR